MKLFREQCYLNGEWTDSKKGKTIAVKNPSTGALIGHIPMMDALETRKAIEAANRALPGWRAKTGKERSRLLRRWFELIEQHCGELAEILTREQGKPLSEATAEIHYSSSFVEWFAEEAKRVNGDVLSSPRADQRIIVLKQPIGVTAAITPWNFPSAMITRKCAPALAAGCTIIVKPSELTPFSAFALAALAEEAKIPPGVLNILTGDAIALGKEMTENPLVRKITFTGSTRVGKILYAQSANNVKKLSLELGGSAPFLVFPEADLDAAVDGLLAARFRNSGQACNSADRALIHSEIYEAFAQKLIKRVRQLKVADGFEEGAQQGPLINEAAVENLETQIRDAVSKGAKILCGGKRHSLGRTFFEPTILAEATSQMLVAQEESFGPLIPLIRFSTEEEAIQIANNSRYGLASYLFSGDINRILRVTDLLETGMISVNGGFFSNEVLPFGGIKESGFGREGSKYGIEDYLVLKSITFTTS